MSSQYEAEKRSVGVLLTMTTPVIQVPEWQRNYSWNTTQVEAFWQDISSFSERYPDKNIDNQEYFLGSIVLVDNGKYYELLDGQQRLATATILLSVIRDKLHEYKADAATRIQAYYISAYDDANDTEKFKLDMNRFDREFFRQEIQRMRVTDYQPPIPKLESHRLIRNARSFFEQVVNEKYIALGGGKIAYQWALRMKSVLTDHVSLVAVVTLDEDNAASVFEVLNDRGIGLSTPDLLRNLLLRRAADDMERERIIEQWRSVLEIEDSSSVEEFLRHYWLSNRGDVKTRALYREIKDTLYKEDINSLDFSLDLNKAADIYDDIISARDSDVDIRKLSESRIR